MQMNYVNALSYILYFIFNGLMFLFASTILNKCTNNIFVLTFLSFANVFITYLFLTSPSYNSPFSFYFATLFLLIIEFRIISRAKLRQILFCACMITFHVATMHSPLIIILAHSFNISPLSILHNYDLRLFSIMLVCIFVLLASFIIKIIIPVAHIKRLSSAKEFSWMIIIYTFVSIAIITISTILLFTDELYLGQLIISITTPIFYMALFYYNFKYAIHFLNMTMYKRQSDNVKSIYDEVLQQKKVAIEKAMKDTLTELYNKQFGHDSLVALCKSDNNFGLLFIDVNALKYVNDNYGHENGDLLLKEVADVIAGAIRDVDIACRFGGDEFIVILHDVQESALSSVINRISANIQIKNDIEPFPVSASIGCVFVTEELRKNGPENILALADKKMRLSKKAFYENGGANF